MPNLAEQREFDKIDLFLREAKTGYSFEIASYRPNDGEQRKWYASIQRHLYDDDIQVLGSGSTRLEALLDLNTQLEANPSYKTTDYNDPEFNHAG